MHVVDLNTVETIGIQSAIDPARRVRVAFPISSATGTASSATVYFEVEPGDHVGVHVDSAEEFLLILEGSAEALVGDELGRAEAGQVVVVPPMLRHDVTNVGEGVLRVLGTFSSSTVVSTFEEPVAPGGPQVFVIGAPMPVMLPLEVPVAV